MNFENGTAQLNLDEAITITWSNRGRLVDELGPNLAANLTSAIEVATDDAPLDEADISITFPCSELDATRLTKVLRGIQETNTSTQ